MAYFDEEDDILNAEPELPSMDDFGNQLSEFQRLKNAQLAQQVDAENEQEIGTEISDLESAFPEQDLAPVVSPLPGVPVQTPNAIPSEPGDYQKLLAHRQDQLRNLALMRGSQQIGQAFVGGHTGNFKTDTSGIDALEKLANVPVEDYTSRQKAEKGDIGLKDERTMRDAKSTISQFYRSVAQKRGMDVTEDMSAWDIGQMMKNLGKPAQGRGQQIVRVFNPQTKQVELQVFDPMTGQMAPVGGIAGYAGQVREDPRTGELINIQPGIGQKTGDITSPTAQAPKSKDAPVALDKSYLTTKQNAQLDKSREQFLKETETTRESIQAAENINALIKYGRAAGADMMRAIQNQLARANGEKGAMSQADVEGFGGEQSLMAIMKRWSNMRSFGELPESDRKILTGLGTVMKQRAEEYYNKQTNFFGNNMYKDLKSSPNLKDVNFSPDSVKSLLGSKEFGGGKRVVKKGYNQKTDKTQVIYDDGSKEILDGKQ